MKALPPLPVRRLKFSSLKERRPLLDLLRVELEVPLRPEGLPPWGGDLRGAPHVPGLPYPWEPSLGRAPDGAQRAGRGRREGASCPLTTQCLCLE